MHKLLSICRPALHINLAIVTISCIGIFSCNDSTQTTNHQSPSSPVQSAAPNQDFMYQYSIMDALLAGVYDGNLTFGELKKKGDFGIGAFNGLDGEMIMLGGQVYKMRYNGEIKEVSDQDSTPLAFVKFFKADTTLLLTGHDITYSQVKKRLDSLLNTNTLYAIKYQGRFKTIDARSVAPAAKPYPELMTHLARGGQTAFKFSQTTGVCIGFLLPPFMARTNVPGYHVHFISEDRKYGGHVFEFTTDTLSIEIDQIKGYIVEANTNKEFVAAALAKDRQEQLKKVE